MGIEYLPEGYKSGPILPVTTTEQHWSKPIKEDLLRTR
jgi:hypothetical protein